MAIIASNNQPRRHSGPGAYFAVLASGFVATLLLALIFDQLGTPDGTLTLWIVGFPVAAFAVIGVSGFATSSRAWFACDRACPPALGAASSLVSILGGVGFVALPGAFFVLGFDALPFTSGIVLGLLLHAVLIAPFARKEGSSSLAGFIGRRFESRILRIYAAVALTLPCLLIMIGEFKLAAFLLGHALQQDSVLVVGILAAVASLTVGLAGMRGAVWGGAAAATVALLVLMVLPALSGLLVINLPVPQVAYGLARAEMARLELAAGMDTHQAASIVLTLPGQAPQVLVKPFMQPFVANDPWSFGLLTISIGLGIATMPALFARAGTSPTVISSRRMSVWLMCLAGGVVLTLPAVAFVTRLALLHALPESPLAEVPTWLERLRHLGLAEFYNATERVPLSAVHFTRDSTNMLLPLTLGLPSPFVEISLATAAAVGLAAITSQAMALAALWADDIAFAFAAPASAERPRVEIGRAFAVIAIVIGAVLSFRVRADALALFAWAMALSGSSVFALLVLSVWWKRVNEHGAMAGLLTGSLVALGQILLSLNGAVPLLSGVSGALASILAAPLSAAVAIAVSLATPAPPPALVEHLRDIRMGGGETVRDREIRLARLRQPDAA